MMWVETLDYRFVNTNSGVVLRPYRTDDGRYTVLLEVPGERPSPLRHLSLGSFAEVREKIGHLIVASGGVIAADELAVEAELADGVLRAA